MVKAIFFDIDGTLYSYEKTNKAAMDKVASYAQKNLGWDRDKTFSALREANAVITSELGPCAAIHNRLIRFQRALYCAGVPVFPHAENMYHIYWDTLIEESVTFDHIPQALSALKEKGFKIMAVTNMTAFIQFKKLEHLYLTPYFDYILSSEEVGFEKPSARMFHKAAELALCEKEECVYVGDSLKNDYYGALDAGLKAVWFRGEEPSVAGEDVLSFSDWSDLPGLIGRLNENERK